MSFRLLFSLILMPLVLSQPDLCQNPKLDSITYVSDKKIWFFTSGGYFWYVKENDFPPGPSRGKLPEGFNRGDAAFYGDFMNVCAKTANSRQKIRKTDQMIYLVEKVGDKNKVIEFDTRKLTWSKTSHDWASDRVLGRSKIDDIGGEIDAIFSKNDSEVYVVQKKKYAANDWLNVCSNPDSYAKVYEPGDSDQLQSSKGSYDSIAVKGDIMYSFIGPNFWKSKINAFQSKNGKIVITKGNMESVSSAFFNFKDCTAVPTEQSGQQNPIEATSAPEKTEDMPSKEEPEPAFNENEGNANPSTTESSGSGAVIVIVIIVVVLVVVALVIGAVVLAMRRKSEPEAKGGAKPQPSSKAKATKAPKK